MISRGDIRSVNYDESGIVVELNDGRRAVELFTDYPRLARASNAQRRNFVLSHFGMHWPELDEDLSFDGFFQ